MYFLPLHFPCYFKDSLYRGQAKSFFYLWLPSDSCHYILCNPFLHVSQTPLKGIC
uniref:Alternative protein OR5M8 n=1 Tax=Homo sapiens TaxID=9606 RepID=L8E6Z4_HUMAN|nr:alternative protein OR5M8 [Homo sapiens]